ncbi:MAG: hypothetical protein K8F91_14365 [Candidatus Obscuribacterales bacterium]|nr:hypothetical protein [Candidatus Obscuribacterales bacterium]
MKVRDADSEMAQEAIRTAFETRSRTERSTLARLALEISADCVDAYVLLPMTIKRTLPPAVLQNLKALIRLTVCFSTASSMRIIETR